MKSLYNITAADFVKMFHPNAFAKKYTNDIFSWWEISYHKSGKKIKGQFKDEYTLLSIAPNRYEAYEKAKDWILNPQSGYALSPGDREKFQEIFQR